MQSTANRPSWPGLVDDDQRGRGAPESRSDAAAKWKPIWVASYFIGLTMASILAARANERPHGTSLVIVYGLAGVAALWHWVAAVRRPEAHRITKPMLLWSVVAIGLTAMLVWMAPVYLFAASFLFANIFQLMPWKSASATAMLLAIALFKPIESSLGHSFAMISLCMAFGACLLSGFVTAVIEQNRERRRTIDDLRDAEALLAKVERHTGQMEERARIARELHDTVTQDLVGITLQLDTVKIGAGDQQKAIDRLRDLSRGALADARGLVHANRPRELTTAAGSSLPSALDALAARYAGQIPRVNVSIDEDAVLDPEQQAVLFRVAQEAVSNARRHARARLITITVSVVGSQVFLDVNDDGVGFDPRSKRSGFGLESMAARVRALSGTLSIESECAPAEGSGTTIHVELPIWKSAARKRAL
jgi:signal transduction histidine kinase